MRKSLLMGTLVMLLVVGCGFTKEEEIKVESMGLKSKLIDPPTYAQKVTVTIEPKDFAVSAYVVTESNREAVEKALMNGSTPDTKLVLAHKSVKPSDAKETYTLEASIPPKTAYALVISNGNAKEATVKYKIVAK